MAQRPIFGEPIQPSEQWAVASYLIAISPDLQSTAKRRRGEEERAIKTRSALNTAITEDNMADSPTIDPDAAREMFEAMCSQCHELSEVAAYPLGSGQDVRDLLERMVENGLEATEEEMKEISWYLTQTFVVGGR
jgi:mono/diheme cytochrome c family protein